MPAKLDYDELKETYFGGSIEPLALEVAFLPMEDGAPLLRLPDAPACSEARRRAAQDVFSFVGEYEFEPLMPLSLLWCFMQGVCAGEHMHRQHDPVLLAFQRDYQFSGEVSWWNIGSQYLPWRRGFQSELAFWLPRYQEGPILVVRQRLRLAQ